MKRKWLNVISNESGASLLFVLGVMMFLLTLSVSALAAATANKNAGVTQQASNRLAMFDDSVHKSIRYSLEQIGDGTEETLCEQLLLEAYARTYFKAYSAIMEDLPEGAVFADVDEFYNAYIVVLEANTYTIDIPEFEAFTFNEFHLGGEEIAEIESVTIHLDPIARIEPELFEDGGGDFTIFQTALIRTKITVVVKINYPHGGPNKKSLMSVAEYTLKGAELQGTITTAELSDHLSVMEITTPPELKLISYDRVDVYD